MIRAFVVYFFRRDLKSWRHLRRLCMAKLPLVDRKAGGL